MDGSPEPLFPQPLLDVLVAHPGRAAFEHGSRVVSYGEQLALVRQMAGVLRAVGLGPRSVVAMVAHAVKTQARCRP